MKIDIHEIDIKDIKTNGLQFSEAYPASELGILDEELKCISPITIKAQLEKVEGTILAHTEVQGIYSFLCSRCLEEVQDHRCELYDFDYEIAGDLKTINLGEDIRQEIILSLPTKILCKDNCRGICIGCGVNLNKEKCTCVK